jgi:hypothetical protein
VQLIKHLCYSLSLGSLLFLTACGPSSSGNGPCDQLCDALVIDCSYAAFPTHSSCESGCLYNEAEFGADIEGEVACVEEAECDTFKILECEHSYGPTN